MAHRNRADFEHLQTSAGMANGGCLLRFHLRIPAYSSSMNLREIVAGLIFAGVCAGAVFSAGNELDELAYADAGPLRFYVDAGWRQGIPIAESAANSPVNERTLEIQVFVQNRGIEPVRVALGLEKDLGSLRTDDRLVVTKFIHAGNGPNGIPLKPPPEDLRTTTLAPGEMSKLPFASVQVLNPAAIHKIEFGYSVDPQLGKWYEVWTGRVKVAIEIKGTLE